MNQRPFGVVLLAILAGLEALVAAWHTLQYLGIVPVTLGPRILRTETAGIVAVAALQLLLGDLG